MITGISVLPEWMLGLPLQQQSVLLLALRGPDGVAKHHPMKDIQRHYRGTILMAAKYGRHLEIAEMADSFMSMGSIRKLIQTEVKLGAWRVTDDWEQCVRRYFDSVDELPHHFHMHLMHGAQILGYKHPSTTIKTHWLYFYAKCVDDAHLSLETREDMDKRLGDWGQEHWED